MTAPKLKAERSTDAEDAQWHEEAAKHYDAKAEAFERENPYTAPELNLYANTARAHRRAAEVLHSSGDDAGTPEAGPPLTPELREAMAKIEADVRRLQYRGDRARPFPTIYDILAQTPEQGTDLPRAITTAMFGNGYLLSEHRRLLAIALVSAIGALLPRSDRGNEHAGSERMEVLVIDDDELNDRDAALLRAVEHERLRREHERAMTVTPERPGSEP